MKKLKVLYIIDTLEGYGAEKSLVEIARCFRNIIPVFVHIYPGDMLKSKLEAAGIKVYSLDINKKYSFNEALEKLRPIYFGEKPDIIHATLYRSEIISRKLKKEFPGICLVGSFVSNAYSHERYEINNPLQRIKLRYFHYVDKETAKYVDYFISNSNTIKQITGAALKVPMEKIQVIYRGRNSEEFYPDFVDDESSRFLPEEKFNLLNVSRLIPLKGQADIIKALPEVMEEFPEIRLVLAGDGPSRHELEKLVKQYKLQNHVKFLGRTENISELLIQSHLFIYPSYSEGLPGALIEAMMAEKIIICSDIKVNLECIDEDSAIIFEKGNVDHLKMQIIKVLRDPQKFVKRGKTARIRARNKFELRNVVNEYQNFYYGINQERKSSPLRILHLIQKPQHRGAETFACQLATHQKNQGFQVKIVSVFSGNSKLHWEDEIQSINGKLNARFYDFKAWRNLNKIIENFKPDIIQANAGDTLKYAAFSKLIHRWDTPIIFRNASEVGRYLKTNIQKKLNEFFYKKIACIVSVSKASEEDLIRNFPFLNSRTHVIPVGLETDMDIIPISFKPSHKQHIVHIGGFSFEKNHKGLISIFQKVLRINKNVCLHLIGDGPLRENIEQMVKSQGIENQVYFYGFVTNPLSFIEAADVLVLPSIIEGLPGVILEAMYCKTPVVAYNVGGVKEILNERTGYLVEKDDEENFSGAIIKTLCNPDNVLIETAYKMVIENFRNIELAKKFNKIYKQIYTPM